MFGLVNAGRMTAVLVRVPAPAGLVAERTTVEITPAALGVPLISPVTVFTSSPAGRLLAP